MKVLKLALLVSLALGVSACNGNSSNTTNTVQPESTGTTNSSNTNTTESTAVKTFNEFWQLFDRHYPLMSRKGIDWDAINQQNQTLLNSDTTEQELSDIIAGIIQNTLKDGHTSAQYKDQEFGYEPEQTTGQARLEQMLANTDAQINYEASSIANPYISYGRLKVDNNIGYIKSKVFEPNSETDAEFEQFKQIVDKALTALQDTQGIIVDVRTNGGGSGEFAYYLAGRFATNAPVDVVRMRYKTTTGSSIASLSGWVTEEFQGYPDQRAEGGYMAPTDTYLNQFNASGDFQYANKVALLTSQYSASAAEFFTIALKTQEQVKSFGDKTFGIFSGSEMVTLTSDPNWIVRISVHDVELKYKGEYQSFEGLGIPVDMPLFPTQQQVNSGQDIHLQAAINYINGTDNDASNDQQNASSCSFDGSPSETINYDFEGDFAEHFVDSERWPSENATLSQNNGAAKLTANAQDTSNALEAWKLFNRQMPYNQAWQLSVTAHIPLYWNSNGGNEAQVGAGIYVGKPVSTGQSAKVYETNMAAINGSARFVQAQLIANRLGEDPIDVQFVELEQTKEQAQTSIRFCNLDKTLSYFVDGKQIGNSQAIDSTGLDDWSLTENDMLDIGIMGFAENTTINANSPTLSSFKVNLF